MRGVWLLHDNAPAHKSSVVEAVRDCGYTQLSHPAYSPDLAPCDYYLFRHLKGHLRGTRFVDDDSVKCAVEAWLEGQSEDVYFQSLPEKWWKCVELSGDYIEK